MVPIFNKFMSVNSQYQQIQKRASAAIPKRLETNTSSQIIQNGFSGNFNHVIPAHYSNFAIALKTQSESSIVSQLEPVSFKRAKRSEAGNDDSQSVISKDWSLKSHVKTTFSFSSEDPCEVGHVINYSTLVRPGETHELKVFEFSSFKALVEP